MKLDPVQALQQQFGEAVTVLPVFRGETTVIVEAQRIAEACLFLRDTAGLEFNMLSGIAGIDYYPTEPRFAANYHLLSMRYNTRLRLKVQWSDGDEPIPSVTGVWKNANWEEREVYDMFGVLFKGHPDLRRLLMPPEWDGHPQRKDYPLGYEMVQFSFNAEDIQTHKPLAKE